MLSKELEKNVVDIWNDLEKSLLDVSSLPVKAIVKMRERIIIHFDNVLQTKGTTSVLSSKTSSKKSQREDRSHPPEETEVCCLPREKEAIPLSPSLLLHSTSDVDHSKHRSIEKLDRLLQGIRAFLRRRIPLGALPEPTRPLGKSEKPEFSEKSKKAGSSLITKPIFAVDSFLFLEKDIDELVEEGKIAREYCKCCGSTDIGLTEFITHSFSQDQIVYLVCFLFPHLVQLEMNRNPACVRAASVVPPIRTILDVGSRLGVILWATYFAAQCNLLPPGVEEVVGIELDSKYLALQQEVGSRFCARQVPIPPFSSKPSQEAMLKRKKSKSEADALKYLACRVVGGDCFEGVGAMEMQKADILILHNVFEYFTEGTVGHLKAWNRIKSLVNRPGQLLVCFPSLEETLEGLEAKGAFDVHRVEEHNLESGGKENGKVGKKETNKKVKQKSVSMASQWIASYVEKVDVSEIALEFFHYRQRSQIQENCKGGEVMTSHSLHHQQTDGEECEVHPHSGEFNKAECHSCSDAESDEIPELLELVSNIYVYRVK